MKKYCLHPQLSCPAEVDWIATDNPENFIKSPPNHQEFWSKQPKISYRLNEYGFRCDSFPEIETRDSITFIGCSNTFGVGMNKEKTWPALLSEKLNLKEINLGIAGGSLDSAFRVYNEWQPIHKSKITCLFLPPSSRLEIIRKGGWLNVGHWTPTDDYLSEELLLDLIDTTLNEVRTDRNIAAIKYIAQQTESKLVIVPYHSSFKGDYGRDFMHAGQEWHKATAAEFEKRINRE